jgi:hypothetical protein
MRHGAMLIVTGRRGRSIAVSTGSAHYDYRRILMGHTCGSQDSLKNGDILFVMNTAGDDIRVTTDRCACPHQLSDLLVHDDYN